MAGKSPIVDPKAAQLFAEIEPELDFIMDAIQESGLSLIEQRNVVVRVFAFALAMGVGVTDEIDGVTQSYPSAESMRRFFEYALARIETDSDTPEAA